MGSAARVYMELSKRLQAVAGLVTAGSVLADIGTDHAYIPICLVQSGRIKGAVAMDINRGPLKRAEENIREHGLEDRIHTRLSDGFEALEPGEADCAVIAGMGGGLLVRILKEGGSVIGTLKECILQPQSEIEKVRAFLLEEGFLFIAEDMVEEDGKYYPMMKVACPGRKDAPKREKSAAGACPSGSDWDETELLYGRYLLRGKNPVLREYLEREIHIKQQILKGLEGQDSPRITERKKELLKEVRKAEKGLVYYAV